MLGVWPLHCTRCICLLSAGVWDAACLYNVTNPQQGVMRFHQNIITACCLLGQPWLRLFTQLNTSLQRLILCLRPLIIPGAQNCCALFYLRNNYFMVLPEIILCTYVKIDVLIQVCKIIWDINPIWFFIQANIQGNCHTQYHRSSTSSTYFNVYLLII